MEAVNARILVFLFFGVLSLLHAADELASFPGCTLVPTEWADGDSFRVKFLDGREQTVRIYGADCLEWHVNDESDARRLRAQRRYFGIGDGAVQSSILQARGWGETAGRRTSELLAKPFTVVTSFADGRGDARFQRVYGFVTTSEGEDLASVLVREGLARAFGVARSLSDGTSASEYRKRLEDLELTAASGRQGIWAETDWSRLAQDRQAERKEEAEISQSIGKLIPSGGVDPNSASRDELMSLPGIGDVLANRIIEARIEGPYRTAEDLRRVKGLSQKVIDSPHLRFSTSQSTEKNSP